MVVPSEHSTPCINHHVAWMSSNEHLDCLDGLSSYNIISFRNNSNSYLLLILRMILRMITMNSQDELFNPKRVTCLLFLFRTLLEANLLVTFERADSPF